ncbi:MAG: hypothetical protein M3529_05170 [Actinomycetota bacterium]|nr:hypothetical protein [Actinomycetota bacterium]
MRRARRGEAPVAQPVVDEAPIVTPGLIRLRVLLGPRDDWFTNPSVLGDGRWQVSDDSDRVGLRVIRPGAGRDGRDRTGRFHTEGTRGDSPAGGSPGHRRRHAQRRQPPASRPPRPPGQ